MAGPVAKIVTVALVGEMIVTAARRPRVGLVARVPVDNVEEAALTLSPIRHLPSRLLVSHPRQHAGRMVSRAVTEWHVTLGACPRALSRRVTRIA